MRSPGLKVITLPLYYFTSYLCRYSVIPVEAFIFEETGLSYSELGLSLALLYIGYALALFPAGVMAGIYGANTGLLVGCLGTSLANTLLFLEVRPPYLHVSLFVNGLSQGFMWPSLMQIASLNYPSDYVDRVIGYMLTAAILGPTGVFVLSWAISLHLYWRYTFLIYPSLLILLTAYLLPRSKLSARLSSHRVVVMKVLTNRYVAVLGMSYACFYAVLRGLLSWLPSILLETEGLTSLESPLYSGFFPLIGAFSAGVGAYLARERVGVKQLVMGSFLLTSLLLSLTLLLEVHGWSIALVFLVLSMPEWLFFTVLPLVLTPSEVSVASGLIDAMGYLGGALGASLIGVVYDAYGSFELSLTVLACLALLGAVLSHLLPPKVDRA